MKKYVLIILAVFMLTACGRKEKEATYVKPAFTNKYGTSATKCYIDGCNNYIASSGDTNCCVRHSNNCGNCGCYIDWDASFCMACIEKALYS